MLPISINSSIFTNNSWSNLDEQRAYRYIRVLEGINKIFSNVVQAKTEEELGNTCLSVALEITGSQYGFIGEVGVDGRLHDIAISEMGWEKCIMHDNTGNRRPSSCFIPYGLSCHVINIEKGFFTNDPQSHTFSADMPTDQPPLSSFLGVPLIEDEKVVGILVVANREGGYYLEQLEDLEAISSSVIQALKRNKVEKALHDAFEQIQTQSDELSLQSDELQMKNEELEAKSRELQVQNEELQALFEEIQTQNEELQAQSEEIQTRNEEFQAQSEKLNKANEELRENEERYRMLFTSMTEGFVLLEVMYNEDGKPHDYRYLEINSAYELNTGIKREKALGKPIKEAFPNINPMVIEKLEEVALSGQSTNFEMFSQVANGYFDVFIFIPQKGKIASIFRDISDRRRSEEAILVKEAELELIANATPIILNRLSRDLKFVFANHTCAEMFGLTREEIIGKPIVEILGEDAFERIRPYVEKVLQGQRVEYETEIPYKGGGLRFMHVTYIPERNGQGEVIGWLASIMDITERKRAEETLRESEERFRALVTSSSEVVYRMSPDWSEMNQLYGRGFLADTENPSSNWIQEYILLEDKPHVWAVIKEAILKKSVFVLEHRVRKVDGSVGWVVSRAVPLLDANGEIVEWFGTASDITERKRAEEALKEAKETLEENIKERTYELKRTSEELEKRNQELVSERRRLYDVLETIPAMVCLLTPDYHVAFANRSFREKFGEPCGRRCYEHCFGYTQPCEFCESYKVFETGQPHHWEVVCPDGSIVDAYDFPFTDVDGSPLILEMNLDITERRKAEEALAKIDIVRKQEIHHRIKNNLQVISSLLDLQAEKFRGKKNIEDSQILEAFKESQDRVISMALIHEELHKGGEINTLNFSTYIQELADNLFISYRLGNEGTSLDMSIEENILFDLDVAVPLGIIVNELISNSLKYAFVDRDKGEIQIKLQREEREECKIEGNKSTTFVLSVSDNGVGIPEDLDIEDLDSLGHQLVTTLVEQLDGELELNRNNGTEFIIMFTVIEKDNQTPAPCPQIVDNDK